MNDKGLTKESIKYIISRLIANVDETILDSEKRLRDTFEEGKMLAYYEMLDILQTELAAHGENLSDYGLSFDVLNKTMLPIKNKTRQATRV